MNYFFYVFFFLNTDEQVTRDYGASSWQGLVRCAPGVVGQPVFFQVETTRKSTAPKCFPFGFSMDRRCHSIMSSVGNRMAHALFGGRVPLGPAKLAQCIRLKAVEKSVLKPISQTVPVGCHIRCVVAETLSQLKTVFPGGRG